MRTLPLVLVGLVATAVGVGLWMGLRAADPPPSAPRPLGAEESRAFDERLGAALQLIKAADDRVGTERESTVAQAQAMLSDLAVQAPSDQRVAFWQGVAGVLSHDEESARAGHSRLRSLLGLAQRDPSLRYLACLVALEFDPPRAEGALKVLRSLQAEVPAFLPEPVERAVYRALLGAAIVHMEANRHDQAIAALEEAVERSSKDLTRTVEARRLLASAYRRAGRFLEAQEQWEWLVERSKGKAADVVAGLASAYAAQNQWDKAIETFDRALALRDAGQVWRRDDPGLDELLLRRGNCYRLQGHPERALADLQAHLASHPDDHRAMYWLATLYLDPLDEPARARDLLERARALAPYCDNYLRLLVQVHEIRLPDAAKAEAARRELEEGVEAREKERARIATQDRGGRFICE